MEITSLRSFFVALGFIGAGACLGAWLRWLLGMALNRLCPFLPAGTLVANYLGAFVLGFALGMFSLKANMPPYWKLFIITGFAGALSTFSTFSAEILDMLQGGRFGGALLSAGLHTAGSVLLVFVGMYLAGLLFKAA